MLPPKKWTAKLKGAKPPIPVMQLKRTLKKAGDSENVNHE
jgi:TusA-related sulfurtransferase